jgi:hypothetical protein
MQTMSWQSQETTEQAWPELHETWVPPQTPAVQVLPVVQQSALAQVVPSGLAALPQAPVCVSQVAVWQLSEAVQLF